MKKYPTNEERKAAKAAKRNTNVFVGAIRRTESVNPFADEKEEETTTGHSYMVNGKYNPDMSEINAMNDRKMWNKR